MGVFSDFDDTLWSKSSIYTLCAPFGSIVDATVKVLTGKLNLKFSSFGFESSPVDTLLSKDSYKLNDETIF